MDSDPNTSIDTRHPLASLDASLHRQSHGMGWVEGGFPHSEIRGSKPVRGSPRLIAAYHVLHRLSAPRHPPDTLLSLDHFRHRCPTGSPKGELGPLKGEPHRHRRWPHRPGEARVQRALNPKTFASERVRDRGRSRLPVTGPRRPIPLHSGSRAQPRRPVRLGRIGKLSLASRPHRQVGHIHSSRCRTTGSPEGELQPARMRAAPGPEGRTMRQPDRAGGEFHGCGRSLKPRWWSKTGSNRRPHACKARALPTELLPHSGSMPAPWGAAAVGLAAQGRRQEVEPRH